MTNIDWIINILGLTMGILGSLYWFNNFKDKDDDRKLGDSIAIINIIGGLIIGLVLSLLGLFESIVLVEAFLCVLFGCILLTTENKIVGYGLSAVNIAMYVSWIFS